MMQTSARRYVNLLRVTGISLIGVAAGLIVGAQETVEFRSIRRLTNGEVAFATAWASNANYRIEVAANLASVTNATGWSGLVTVPPTVGTLQHTDTAAPFMTQRFYRAQQLTGTNALTGDHVSTTNGEVVIHPVNHASLVLSWNGLMIYNDPVGGAGPYSPFPRANLILVSHSHTDHYNNTTLEAVRTNGTVILAPQAVYSGMTTALKAATTVMVNGAATNVLGIDVLAIPAYNSYHSLGSGNGYVVTLGGRRFLFTGDTGDIPELRALSGIDVAFVCMNVPFTMSYTNAASVIRDFRPRVIYPYHYRNQDNSLPDFNDFRRRVGQDLGIEVRLRKWY